MDRGTHSDTPPSISAGTGTARTTEAGRIPLAVVVADRRGRVSHWSTGARRLFAVAAREAIGRPVVDLLPVFGALPEEDEAAPHGPYAADDSLGPGLEPPLDGAPTSPAAGRARLTVPGNEHQQTGDSPPEGRRRVDVLWWAYPLAGPGPERLLVLAADAGGLHHGDADQGRAVERIAPAFAPRTDFPGADELARRLREILPGMSAADSARVVAQVLELGYPFLEFSRPDRVPVTPA